MNIPGMPKTDIYRINITILKLFGGVELKEIHVLFNVIMLSEFVTEYFQKHYFGRMFRPHHKYIGFSVYRGWHTACHDSNWAIVKTVKPSTSTHLCITEKILVRKMSLLWKSPVYLYITACITHRHFTKTLWMRIYKREPVERTNRQ